MRIPALLIALSMVAGLTVGLIHNSPLEKQRRTDAAKIWFDKGLNEQNGGALSEAITSYSRAIQINPVYASAYCNRGSAYSDLELQESAIADFDRAIKLNPNLADAYNNRGTLRETCGENKLALADYSQAISLKSDFVEAIINRAGIHLTLRNPEDAVVDCNKALQINPKNARAHSYLGEAYEELKNFPKAIKEHTAAIQLQPKNYRHWTNRAFSFWILHQDTRAIKDLDESTRLCSSQAYPFYLRGKIFNHQKQYDSAIHDLTWAIALNPSFAAAFEERGFARARAKHRDYRGSLDDAQRAVQLDSNRPSLITDLGISLMRLGLIKNDISYSRRALGQFSEALNLAPDFHLALFFRGVTKTDIGDYKGAIEDLSICAKRGSPGAHYFRAKARLKLKQLREAKKDLEQELLLYPSTKDARELLNSIQE